MTLTLKQAAKFLKMHPETLRLKAIRKEVPGKKLGNWRFLKDDLVNFLRSEYPTPALRGEEAECSAKSKEVVSSILDSKSVDDEYAALLAPKTRNSRRNSSRLSGKSYGRHTG